MRDLVLQRKEILVGPVILLRPLHAAIRGIDELCAHPDHVSRFPHAPFQEVRHSELRPDTATVLLGVAELEGRAAPDDPQSRELPERRDQILRDPVGEVALICIAALVRKRQHGDGGSPRSWELRSGEPRHPEKRECQQHYCCNSAVEHSHPAAREPARGQCATHDSAAG